MTGCSVRELAEADRAPPRGRLGQPAQHWRWLTSIRGRRAAYFTVTVTQSLRSSEPSLPRTRNCTSNRVPETKGAPRCTSKCAAPAPAADVVSGPLINQPDASVHIPSGLRSTARETVYV